MPVCETPCPCLDHQQSQGQVDETDVIWKSLTHGIWIPNMGTVPFIDHRTGKGLVCRQKKQTDEQALNEMPRSFDSGERGTRKKMTRHE